MVKLTSFHQFSISSGVFGPSGTTSVAATGSVIVRSSPVDGPLIAILFFDQVLRVDEPVLKVQIVVLLEVVVLEVDATVLEQDQVLLLGPQQVGVVKVSVTPLQWKMENEMAAVKLVKFHACIYTIAFAQFAICIHICEEMQSCLKVWLLQFVSNQKVAAKQQ